MTRKLFLLLALLAGSTLAIPAAAAPQTRPWRIGVAGAYSTGYLGLLSLHGLPRELLSDPELLDPARLKQFDIILVGWRTSGTAQALKSIEDFVREGGIALTENLPVPSVEAIPGTRMGPAPAPNVRFVDSGLPLSKGLPELGVVSSAGVNGAAIVPPAESDVVILARFTDEGAPRKFQGHFNVGSQGAPAIVMANVGKGKLIYSGAAISYALSLRGRDFEPFVCNLLNYVSDGQISDRMSPEPLERSELATIQPPPEPDSAYPHPAGTAQDPPEGFEVLDDAANLADFALTGQLAPETEARVLLSYWSPQHYREVVFGGKKVSLIRHEGGKAVTVGAAALPESKDIRVIRRSGLVTVSAGGQQVLAACDGPPQQGALAVKGLGEPSYQPLDAVVFEDDFMRETASSEEWKPSGGTWQVQAAEGKPEQGANPFDYVGTSATPAYSLTGHWFWSDYAYDTACKAGGKAIGLLANHTGPQDYVMLRLSFEAEPAKLQLLRQQGEQQKLLDEAVVQAKKADWHRLGLRTSAGTLLGLLDGQVVLRAALPDHPCGQIGLYVDGGQGNFDDVRVSPWVASLPGPAPQASQLIVMSGEWKNSPDGRALRGTGSDGARALVPWQGGQDCQASVRVNLGQAAAAGLHLRYAGPHAYYLLALMPNGKGLKVRVYRHGSPGAILAERVLPGERTAWHTLEAVVRGRRVTALVDGKELLDLMDTGHTTGAVGLYARGGQPASFRGFTALQIDSDERLVDELTPPFAGIIDRHTWAGRSGAWTPEPANLNRFWHQGYLPGDLQVEAGLHPNSAEKAQANLYLSPQRQPERGYVLQTVRSWASDTVQLVLSRLGKPVARAEAKAEPGQPFAVRLARRGAQLLASINHLPALLFQEKEPLQDLDSIGLDNGGQLLYADDLSVKSSRVYDYTFETAPTDWTVQSGTWEVTSRWSCSPGWAWFSGFNQSGAAEIATKQAYAGDQEVVVYVGAKMMPIGDNKYSERLSDVHLGFLVGAAGAETGYKFIVGGNDNALTELRRNGKPVGTSQYRLPSTAIHNDWLKLTMRKRGDTVSLWAWDTQVLEYQDPEPLAAGRITVGTHRNGILVPRVTIFGERED